MTVIQFDYDTFWCLLSNAAWENLATVKCMVARFSSWWLSNFQCNVCVRQQGESNQYVCPKRNSLKLSTSTCKNLWWGTCVDDGANMFVPGCPIRHLLKFKTCYLWDYLMRNLSGWGSPVFANRTFDVPFDIFVKIDYFNAKQIIARGTYQNLIQLTCWLRNHSYLLTYSLFIYVTCCEIKKLKLNTYFLLVRISDEELVWMREPSVSQPYLPPPPSPAASSMFFLPRYFLIFIVYFLNIIFIVVIMVLSKILTNLHCLLPSHQCLHSSHHCHHNGHHSGQDSSIER